MEARSVSRSGSQIREGQESIVDELRHSLDPQAIRYDRDKVQTSPEDPVAKLMVRLDEKLNRIEQLRVERSRKMLDIDCVLDQLEDDNERTVLTHWYLLGESEETVSGAVPCSARKMYMIKSEGLQHVEDILTGNKSLQ